MLNNIEKDEEIVRRSKREIIIRLIAYLKPYKAKSMIVILLMILVMLCNVVNPYLLQQAIDVYVVNKDINGILLIGGILLVINIFAWIASKIRWTMISKITNNILVNIRHELYEHIQKLSFDFFDNRPVGKILARVVGDVNALKNLFNQSIQTLIPELLSLVCVAMAMFILNVKLAMACIILLPFLTIAMFYIEIHSRKRWEVFRNKRSNLNGFTHEDFSGEIQVGKLIAFSMYTGMFWRPIMNLSSFYNTLITNFAAADRIFDILDQDPDIENIGEAPKMSRIDGKVEFRNIDFSYNVGGKVLNNFNFKVNSGDRIALVGATGSGKTTIISLLSRFYDPTNGEILVDGKNIKYVDLYSYRSQMGIMLQDTFLFSSTIMENIRYGRLDATDEEVINAAKAVNAHEFIMKLENGYDTEVNERGSRLSLGQRQLVSFARALLANPRILILDEATSNIDTQTEMLVQKGIEKLIKGRTSFVIAHRLSTIRDCDKILVISDGEIIESGTHDELLRNKGMYYDLYSAQYKFLNEGA